ncbi:MAG: flagellar basal body protein [Cognatishimia sp.]|uniref:flagellar basal body protein n=1 Tax=Cognatishimia sp. TaxID=2211648 RepID=UPI0040595A26
MNIEAPNFFELASKRLKWLSDSQKTISENIANSETGGFRAKEVEGFDAYLARAESSETRIDANVAESDVTWGEDLTGNSVVLEEQIMAASSTASQHKIASNLYRKAHMMLRAVAGG